MRKRYDQYCPVSHALGLVGERWSLLVVLELMHGPKRYTDLTDRLPGIGTNILASRLRDLEAHGHRREADASAPGGLARLRADRLRAGPAPGHPRAGTLGRALARAAARRGRALPGLARERARDGARAPRAARPLRVPDRRRGVVDRRWRGTGRARSTTRTSSSRASRSASTTCSSTGASTTSRSPATARSSSSSSPSRRLRRDEAVAWPGGTRSG